MLKRLLQVQPLLLVLKVLPQLLRLMHLLQQPMQQHQQLLLQTLQLVL
jgi:hypothetical protein